MIAGIALLAGTEYRVENIRSIGYGMVAPRQNGVPQPRMILHQGRVSRRSRPFPRLGNLGQELKCKSSESRT